MKMRLLKEINKRESGQAFILVLILLLVGGLIIVPLLAFMSTGLIAGRNIEQLVDEVYADDAGIEDAMWKILNGDFESLDVNDESDPYTLTVNGLAVTVTVTKLSLIQGLLGEGEYKIDQPHEGWMEVEQPEGYEPVPGVDTEKGPYFEYTYTITISYFPGAGGATRQLDTVGVYFSPLPDKDIGETYDDVISSPEVTGNSPAFDGYFNTPPLQAGSPQNKYVQDGFTFVWRWETTPPQGPIFEPESEGAFTFTFRIYNDPDWPSPRLEPFCFVWSTYRQQDVSYATSDIDLYRWLIEATAGDTTVRSVILAEGGVLSDILTWEINPPG